MLLSKPLLTRRALSCSTPKSHAAVVPPVQSFSKRDLLAGITSVALLLLPTQHASAVTDVSALNSASGSDPGFSLSITPINKAAKEMMDRRDDAMEFQCKGGMVRFSSCCKDMQWCPATVVTATAGRLVFDCDGDRRDFARKQYQEWLEAGGVPQRIRDGKPDGPKPSKALWYYQRALEP